MDANFWHKKWAKDDIGFHLCEANPLLVTYFSVLSLAKNSRIFVPLCGKTCDIAWLLDNGFRVAGAELSKVAIAQLFVALGVTPEISSAGKLERYSATNIDIFVGDIFDLSSDLLGSVDAVYDRAALVALPLERRHQYTAHLIQMTNKAPQLLICLEYTQNIVDGPPFSISSDEISLHYLDSYQLTRVASNEVAGGLKGECPALENVWLLKND